MEMKDLESSPLRQAPLLEGDSFAPDVYISTK